MPSQEDLNEMVKFFFTLQMLNKLYHWNTTSFARHKATDGFGDVLDSNVDRFLELFMGRYKLKPQLNGIKLDPEYLTNGGFVKLFEQARSYLESFNNKLKDADLLTVRDELLGEVNKMLYLFTLN